MFYERYETLCKRKGISLSKAATEMGINRASVTLWKNSPDIVPSGNVLLKVANYFGVSADYLLGLTAELDPTAYEGLNIVKITGKDGSLSERILTDDQFDLFKKMIAVIPDNSVENGKK